MGLQVWPIVAPLDMTTSDCVSSHSIGSHLGSGDRDIRIALQDLEARRLCPNWSEQK